MALFNSVQLLVLGVMGEYLGRLYQQSKNRPLYLLEGDDLQSRHDLAVEFAALVDEGLQAFNVQTFYANEATNAGARFQTMRELKEAVANVGRPPAGARSPASPSPRTAPAGRAAWTSPASPSTGTAS